ncbi:MAG TPA: hypothetical protein VGH19_09495 [Verrucomicrobiae bacterium]
MSCWRMKKAVSGRELAEALKETSLTTREAAKWSRDLKKARKALKPVVNKWK